MKSTENGGGPTPGLLHPAGRYWLNYWFRGSPDALPFASDFFVLEHREMVMQN